MTRLEIPDATIDLTSTLGFGEGDLVPNPRDGEWSRSLNKVFEQMEPGAESSTMGSWVRS